MVIQITCPSCAATFPVDPNKIPVAGVKARCSECRFVFLVERPAPIEDVAPEVVAEPEVPVDGLAAAFFGGESPAVTGEAAAEEVETEDWSVDAPEGASDAEIVAEAIEAAEAAPEEVAPEEDASDFAVAEEVVIDEAPAEGEAIELGVAEDVAVEEDPVEEASVVEAPAEPPVEEPAAPVSGFTFGKRDPKDKAKRLARVLVSDMTMYNAVLHESALAGGTLKEDFEEEIDRSWKEYIEQIGPEIAEGEGQTFWRDALNDVLAKGQPLF